MRLDVHKNQPSPPRTWNDIGITALAIALFLWQYYQFVFRYQFEFLYHKNVLPRCSLKPVKLVWCTVFFHIIWTLVCWSYYKAIFTRPGYIPTNFVRNFRDL